MSKNAKKRQSSSVFPSTSSGYPLTFFGKKDPSQPGLEKRATLAPPDYVGIVRKKGPLNAGSREKAA